MASICRAPWFALLLVLGLGASLGIGAVPSAAATPQDNGRLAFVRANQIYTSTTTGTGLRKLTSVGKNYRPQWSPDGTRIAYVHESPAAHRDIWVMKANGSGKQRVTDLGDTTAPTWSPDGKWLAFGANGTPPYPGFFGGRLQKIRATAPFGSPILLPAADPDVEPLIDDTLAWSPDGTKIVFPSLSYPDSPDRYLLIYTLATGAVGLRDLVGGSCCGEGYFRDPTWSNDSKRIALSYQKYADDETPPSSSHIAVLPFPGQGSGTYPNINGDRDPDYSPTGTKMVFNHWSRIFIADANGAHRRNVLQGYHPDWQPVVG